MNPIKTFKMYDLKSCMYFAQKIQTLKLHEMNRTKHLSCIIGLGGEDEM